MRALLGYICTAGCWRRVSQGGESAKPARCFLHAWYTTKTAKPWYTLSDGKNIELTNNINNNNYQVVGSLFINLSWLQKNRRGGEGWRRVHGEEKGAEGKRLLPINRLGDHTDRRQVPPFRGGCRASKAQAQGTRQEAARSREGGQGGVLILLLVLVI